MSKIYTTHFHWVPKQKFIQIHIYTFYVEYLVNFFFYLQVCWPLNSTESIILLNITSKYLILSNKRVFCSFHIYDKFMTICRRTSSIMGFIIWACVCTYVHSHKNFIFLMDIYVCIYEIIFVNSCHVQVMV